MTIITEYLPWLLSACTIYMMIMAGNNHKHTWLFGIIIQVPWLLWILVTGTFGFLPMNVALTGVYIRNHVRGKNDNTIQSPIN